MRLSKKPNGFCGIAREYALSFSLKRELSWDSLPKQLNDEEGFLNIFFKVIKERILKYSPAQIDYKRNLLLKHSDFGIILIYNFFKSAQNTRSEFKSYNFNDHFQGMIEDFRIDLPTMILYTMCLEVAWVRGLIAMLSPEDTKEALIYFHNEIKNICSYQIFFNSEDFASENVFKSKLFIKEVYPSIAILINGL